MIAQITLASSIAAQAPSTAGQVQSVLTIARTSLLVRVDGVLDETAWRDASELELPYETFPGNNSRAPVRTRCRIVYTTDRLSLGCEAEDPRPWEIRAFVSDRDNIGGQDRLLIALDPGHDRRRGIELGINALGVQSDGLVDQSANPADLSWDTIWSSAGRLTESGYVVEVSIPFKSLRFPRRSTPQPWGIIVSRARPRTQSNVTRSVAIDQGNSCVLCQAARLDGLQGVTPGRNVELSPTQTVVRSDRRGDPQDDRLAAGPMRGTAGLDARWGITPSLSFNTTINPDFSNIEADAPQLDVNTTFSLSVPEKRPFFLEGQDIFATPKPAVVTRSIVDPAYGAKLSGKIGRTVVGGLLARDNRTVLLIPGAQGSTRVATEDDATVGIVRLRHDVGRASTVGMLYADRSASGYRNQVIALDAGVRPWPAVNARTQVLHSATYYPDSLAGARKQALGTFAGTAAAATIEYSTRNWYVNVNHESIEPSFRADAGFMPRVDQRYSQAFVTRYVWGRPGAPFTRIQGTVGFTQDNYFAGGLASAWRFLIIGYSGPKQLTASISARVDRQAYAGKRYSVDKVIPQLTLNPSGAFSLQFRGVYGHTIDFVNGRRAGDLELQPSITIRPNRRVELGLSDAYQRLTRHGGEVTLAAHAAQVRAAYNFSARAYLRLIAQPRRVARTPDAFASPADPESTSLASQLLFAYRVNPQTAFFLGYSESRAGSLAGDATRQPFRQMERTIYAKAGYAWRP